MNTIEEIELFAKDHFIPIARKQTVSFMINLIKENNYTSFFEIGTAIGYTSIILAKNFPGMKIHTIEHDLDRICIARRNFEDFKVEKLINFIPGDALTYKTEEKFDLIFIDAAKKRNRYFLEKYMYNLKDNGSIIVDNMHLDDFWIGANKDKKAHYDQVNEEFKEYLKNNPLYDVELFDDIGDGIALIKLKK